MHAHTYSTPAHRQRALLENWGKKYRFLNSFFVIILSASISEAILTSYHDFNPRIKIKKRKRNLTVVYPMPSLHHSLSCSGCLNEARRRSRFTARKIRNA